MREGPVYALCVRHVVPTLPEKDDMNFRVQFFRPWYSYLVYPSVYLLVNHRSKAARLKRQGPGDDRTKRGWKPRNGAFGEAIAASLAWA